MSEQLRTNLILIVATIVMMILVLGLQRIGEAKLCVETYRPNAHKNHLHIEVLK